MKVPYYTLLIFAIIFYCTTIKLILIVIDVPDYELDLDKNAIHIVTKQGQSHTIHADSLQQFIIKDNI